MESIWMYCTDGSRTNILTGDIEYLTPPEPVTMKEMCETIEREHFLKAKDGHFMSAEEIWNYSPTGELALIEEWYAMATERANRRAGRRPPPCSRTDAEWDAAKARLLVPN
jgi:hypothetical protein